LFDLTKMDSWKDRRSYRSPWPTSSVETSIWSIKSTVSRSKT